VIEGDAPQTVVQGEFASEENTGSSNTQKQQTGRVVGIIKRNWRPYCGIILPSANASVCAPIRFSISSEINC
jgi:hypothetical protein